MVKTVIGSFDSFFIASQVSTALLSAGFLQSDINVVSNNAPRDITIAPSPKVADESATASGALTGGALGGAAGLAVSLLGLAVPGVGPILAAGSIATVLAGAGAGAVAGGLIGGLTGLGVPEPDAWNYAESIRRGGALVTVKVDLSRVDEAERIMRQHGAIDIEDRVERWKASGWSGYDADAEPYSPEQIEQERKRNGDSPPPRSTPPL